MSTEVDEREGQRSEGGLFGELPLPAPREGKPGKVERAPGVARVVMPNRTQMEMRPMDLESTLPQGHRARLVWAWVERQDLSAMYEAIKVRQGGVGRSAIAPDILLALWLYATLDGVGSARELARLVLQHDAYRWITGGVQVNYHLLSDFRVERGAALDELLSTSVAALAEVGAVKLQTVAQDGVRVRASAGAASLRRKAALDDKLEAARQHVQRLKEQLQADPGQDNRRKAAAQQRAAQQMQRRLERAIERLPELEAIKRRKGKKAEEARASTTDADASVMKMADGGFRPAYNHQMATDCGSQVIVGVSVSTSGSDMGQLATMVEQVQQRTGMTAQQWLVDGGYPAHEQIDAVADKTEVYAPVPESKPKKVKDKGEAIEESGKTDKACQSEQAHAHASAPDKHHPKPGDSAAVAAWRQRMASPEAKEIYKLRAATAECVNAQARNRGLQRLPVRGLGKVKCVALLFALAHNLMRAVALVPQWFTGGQTPSAATAVAR